MRWIAPILGSLMVLFVLADVYLTVLYARSGTSIIARRIAPPLWGVTKRAARRLPKRKHDHALTFFGPTLLTILATTWVGGLLVGFALIVWPSLGTGVVSTQGENPHDFVTALYFSAFFFTTVGNGDLRPATGAYKLLAAFHSVVGISVITLMLTYFMQVYNALQRRTTLALKLHLGTGCSGDAAKLIAGLGAAGEFDSARSLLAGIADEVAGVYEAHHFYGALIYFRFAEGFYATPRVVMVVMDTAALIRTALNAEKYAFLTRSGSVTQLDRAGLHLLDQLSRVFLPPLGKPNPGAPAEASDRAQWRTRYFAALQTLRAAGIATTPDEQAGADAYVADRKRWDGYVMSFAAYLDHPIPEVDPAGAAPGARG